MGCSQRKVELQHFHARAKDVQTELLLAVGLYALGAFCLRAKGLAVGALRFMPGSSLPA